MRKFGRLLLKLLGIIAALIVVLAVYIYSASNKKLHRTLSYNPQPITLPTDAEALARGRHLAEVRGCTTCHGADLGGAVVIDNPAMGLMSGPNLTSGDGSVTKNYQIVDWVRSLQHGVNPSGRPLVLMPSEEFAHLTQQDLGDVIAYVKSVPPVNRASVPVRLGPVARGLIVAGKFTFAADKIDHGAAPVEALTPAVSIEYGHYVAASCVGCHNPNFSGGKIASGPPDWPPAANLTADPHSEFKDWTEADFVNALRLHKKPNGQPLNKVMPEVFGKLSDTELKAIFVYLRSLPPKPTGA